MIRRNTKAVVQRPVVIREDTAILQMNRLRPAGEWLGECIEAEEQHGDAPELGDIMNQAREEYAKELEAAGLPALTKK